MQLPAPTGVTARYQGFGSPNNTTTFYYWLQALYPEGWSQLSTPANTGANCPAGLSAAGLVAVQWNPAPGAIGYLLYRNTTGTTPADAATAIFIGTSETGFKDDGTLATFTQVPRYDSVYVAKALYNFAVDGGVAGAIIPAISDTIPKGAICFGGVVNSPTAFTGATTVAIGTSAGSSASSIMAATAIADLSIDAVLEILGTNSQAATNKPSFKMTAAGQIQLTLVGAATAGVLEVNVLYVVATNP